MNKIYSVLFTLLIFLSDIHAGNLTALKSVEPDSLIAAREDSITFKVPLAEGGLRDSAEITPWHQMVTRLPEDYYSFFKKSFSTSALPIIAGLAAATGALMIADEPLGSWSHSMVNRSDNYNHLSDIMVKTGDGRYHFLLAGALSLYGLSAGDERALKTAGNLAEGILASGIMVQVLKRITGRQSPEVSSNDAGEWRLFPNPSKYQKNQPRYYAFPSGHITTAALTFTVLANNYPEYKWIRPAGYIVLGGLGLGLMSKGMHWASDFPLGVLIGYTFGNIVAPENGEVKGEKGRENKGGFSVLPFYSPSYSSVSLLYSF
ncbi:MAG TPA: phosphatase PAP2 family protein [Ignavibacteriales bacterium]|nr:phosphatase PAP2 family protein [Ignavibacteriales bacterium]